MDIDPPRTVGHPRAHGEGRTVHWSDIWSFKFHGYRLCECRSGCDARSERQGLYCRFCLRNCENDSMPLICGCSMGCNEKVAGGSTYCTLCRDLCNPCAESPPPSPLSWATFEGSHRASPCQVEAVGYPQCQCWAPTQGAWRCTRFDYVTFRDHVDWRPICNICVLCDECEVCSTCSSCQCCPYPEWPDTWQDPEWHRALRVRLIACYLATGWEQRGHMPNMWRSYIHRHSFRTREPLIAGGALTFSHEFGYGARAQVASYIRRLIGSGVYQARRDEQPAQGSPLLIGNVRRLASELSRAVNQSVLHGLKEPPSEDEAIWAVAGYVVGDFTWAHADAAALRATPFSLDPYHFDRLFNFSHSYINPHLAYLCDEASDMSLRAQPGAYAPRGVPIVHANKQGSEQLGMVYGRNGKKRDEYRAANGMDSLSTHADPYHLWKLSSHPPSYINRHYACTHDPYQPHLDQHPPGLPPTAGADTPDAPQVHPNPTKIPKLRGGAVI